MEIDEVKYIRSITGMSRGNCPFWGILCKNCGLKYDSAHTASSMECATFNGTQVTTKGTFFSPQIHTSIRMLRPTQSRWLVQE